MVYSRMKIMIYTMVEPVYINNCWFILISKTLRKYQNDFDVQRTNFRKSVKSVNAKYDMTCINEP